MAAARGALHVTTGDSVALAASTYTVLGAASMPALVMAGVSLQDFDMPVVGRLRYLGAEARTFGVRASLTAFAPGAVPVNFEFAVAKNGVPVEASEQTRSLWALLGHQGVTCEALVTLAPSDYVEVYVSASALAALDLAELSLVAAAAELVASEGVVLAPASGADWIGLEALLERTLIGSALAEVTSYTPTGEPSTDVRGIFSLNQLVIEAGEIRIATHSPHVGYRVADLPVYPAKGFGVVARGQSYVVADGGVIPYGGGEHVELLLHGPI